MKAVLMNGDSKMDVVYAAEDANEIGTYCIYMIIWSYDNMIIWLQDYNIIW
jgi:hypothetical protein